MRVCVCVCVKMQKCSMRITKSEHSGVELFSGFHIVSAMCLIALIAFSNMGL